jgi:hypothetical protein
MRSSSMLNLLAPILIAALLACAGEQAESSDSRTAREPTPAEVADPMASFARFLPGEWRVTFASGTSAFDTWHWGPGKHSIRGGELEVFYWHPGRKQVRMLSLHPDIPGVGRGSGEGTIRFEGETAEGFLDLYQPRGVRKLGIRWEFDGPDKYHDTLLEMTGPEGFKPQNAWDRFRVPKRSEARPRAAADAPQLPEHLKVFEPILGGTWETEADPAAGNASRTRSTFELIPDYVYGRVVVPSQDGDPTHVLDAYVYQHVRTGVLRCLALSDRGGVYEGDLTVLGGGALQLDLDGYEGNRVVRLVVRVDFEPDGSLHHRVWSLEGAARTQVLDVRARKVETKKD